MTVLYRISVVGSLLLYFIRITNLLPLKGGLWTMISQGHRPEPHLAHRLVEPVVVDVDDLACWIGKVLSRM